MAVTSRLGLRLPAGADNFKPTIDIPQIVGILDNAAIDQSGTLAARPVATAVKPGTYYFATDTLKLYRSDATTWTLVSNPFFTGTFAGRPAANTVPAGAWYRSTDTGDLAVSDGTTWFTYTPANRCLVYETPQSPTSSGSNLGDTEIIDVGNNWGGGPGVVTFVAPVKGNYRFRVEAASGGTVQMRKNTVAQRTLAASTQGEIFVSLAAGDTLDARVNSGTMAGGSFILIELLAQTP